MATYSAGRARGGGRGEFTLLGREGLQRRSRPLQCGQARAMRASPCNEVLAARLHARPREVKQVVDQEVASARQRTTR